MLRLIVNTKKKMKKRVLALVMEQSSSESSDALSIELSVSMQQELMKQNKKLTRTLSETLKTLNAVQRDNEMVHEYCEQLENELAYKTIMLASFERQEKEEQEKKEPVGVKRRKTQLDKLLEQNERFNRWHK